MKVVAYNIKDFEKEPLAKANQRKHDITLISNELSLDTIQYAEGKQAVLICQKNYDELILSKLANLGIKYLLLFSDKEETLTQPYWGTGLKIFQYCNDKGNKKPELVQKMANFAIQCLDNWQAKIGKLNG